MWAHRIFGITGDYLNPHIWGVENVVVLYEKPAGSKGRMKTVFYDHFLSSLCVQQSSKDAQYWAGVCDTNCFVTAIICMHLLRRHKEKWVPAPSDLGYLRRCDRQWAAGARES